MLRWLRGRLVSALVWYVQWAGGALCRIGAGERWGSVRFVCVAAVVRILIVRWIRFASEIKLCVMRVYSDCVD